MTEIVQDDDVVCTHMSNYEGCRGVVININDGICFIEVKQSPSLKVIDDNCYAILHSGMDYINVPVAYLEKV